MLSSLLYRLGRKLYTTARQEIDINQISINGEAWLQKRISDNCSTNNVVFFDIGANLGEWSSHALALYTSNKISIHAFEPVEATYLVLKDNLAKQEVSKDKSVTVNQFAISNRSGEEIIHITSGFAGSNSLHGGPDAITTEVIFLTTIDEYCHNQGIRVIDLLKIDIEGHDFFAIQGAKEMLIHKKIGVLQFEYNHRWVFSRCFIKDVFDFCNQYNLDYKIGRLTSSGICLFQEWHYELEKFFEGNYVLVRTDLTDALNCQQITFNKYNALVANRPE